MTGCFFFSNQTFHISREHRESEVRIMSNGELIKWAIVLITIKYTSNAEMLVNHVSYKYQKLFLYRVQPNELDIKKITFHIFNSVGPTRLIK